MLITVFTPTYNRAYSLPKLYKSLCNQTCKDFCWLVIDDGSTDDTQELLEEYIAEKVVSISYILQQNSGKHVAHNKAVEFCQTELFICVDSDDYLTENAIEIIKEKYFENENSNILGMYFRRVFNNGKNIATSYPQNLRKVKLEDLYHKYNFCGDTAIVLKTALIKPYRFPVFEGEKFVTERIFYNKINHIAPMLLCEEGIYVCEYLEDGLTRNIKKIERKNPYGTTADFLSEACYGTRFWYRVLHSAKFFAYLKKKKLDINKFNEIETPPKYILFLGKLFRIPYAILKM